MSRLTIDRIELALLLAFAFTALWGAGSVQKQENLAEKMVRLHVIARSDSESDQAVKLLVRDNILSFTQGLMKGVSGVDAAEKVIESHLPDIQRIANATLAESGCGYTAKADVKVTEFPEKTYDSFALPGGKYLALRVLLGEAEGKNWWCVVYPPLCSVGVEESEPASLGLGEEELRLITQDSPEYVIRFQCAEWWSELTEKLGGE